MIRFIALILIVSLLVSFKTTSQPNNPFTPPEFFPSKSVIIEWPFNYNIWPLYSELINECQEVAKVILLVRDSDEEGIMQNLLINDGIPLSNIVFIHVPCERMWIRDHGPLAIMTANGMEFMDFNDLADSGLDELLPTNLAELWGMNYYQIDWVLDGGNFLVDSQGTLFTTDRLYSNNPSITKETIDGTLRDFMGIQNIVTVSAMHNDYWGHIDMQMKLLNDTIMIISSVDQGSGPNYDTLENNYQKVRGLSSPNGKPYHIARLPKADNWKTYVNSLILNNKVIVPIYNNPNDELALQIYSNLLPDHVVVGINCNSIIGWEGAIHCITMQLFDEEYFATNIEQRTTSSPLIYPNPVFLGNTLSISLKQTKNQYIKFTVTTINGSIVERHAIFSEDNGLSILWRHPPGVYILAFDIDGQVFRSIIISQ